MNIENIQGLDTEAWERWVAYRKAIRKPLKEVSMHAAALKLAKYGADQSEVVAQSISNQWQGLFELRKAKADPYEPKQKTDKQKAADDARWLADQERNERHWNSILDEPLGKLKLADALLARYNVQRDSADVFEKIEWLKGRVADLLRETDPKTVIADPNMIGMVRNLWGENGVNRIRSRAAQSV